MKQLHKLSILSCLFVKLARRLHTALYSTIIITAQSRITKLYKFLIHLNIHIVLKYHGFVHIKENFDAITFTTSKLL